MVDYVIDLMRVTMKSQEGLALCPFPETAQPVHRQHTLSRLGWALFSASSSALMR
jgi:hypothetical protein